MKDELKGFISEHYMANENFGVIVDTETPVAAEQLGITATKFKKELKAMNCLIYKARPKAPKNPETYEDKVAALKIRKVKRMPKYLQSKSVRQLISPALWTQIRNTTLEQSNYCCSVCDYTTDNLKKLHVHEEWKVDEENLIINLTGLSLLCHMCHALKHWQHTYFRTSKTGEWPEVQRKLNLHFMRVNECSQEVLIAADRLASRTEMKVQFKKEEGFGFFEKQKQLETAEWSYSIFPEIPFREEVIFHLRKKVTVTAENL